jgi:hypothetical protein
MLGFTARFRRDRPAPLPFEHFSDHITVNIASAIKQEIFTLDGLKTSLFPLA